MTAPEPHDQADLIIVGAGLSGLVAAAEALDAGRSVLLLDQENEANLGAQAWWSFGGLFLIDSPEQRRLGIRDGVECARDSAIPERVEVDLQPELVEHFDDLYERVGVGDGVGVAACSPKLTIFCTPNTRLTATAVGLVAR